MKVKVCGITELVQLEALEVMGADFAGLIFYPLSKRFAAGKLGGIADKVRAVPIKKVGVFVNEDLGSVLGYIQAFGLHAVQLHGDEDVAYCRKLMKETVVIKVFRLEREVDIDALVAPFADCCHYYLFDTATEGYGGSGKKFNWDVLEKAAIGKPYFLSGGIAPNDVGRISSLRHPWLQAVDINSSFEIAPGVKDMGKVSQFILDMKGLSGGEGLLRNSDDHHPQVEG